MPSMCAARDFVCFGHVIARCCALHWCLVGPYGTITCTQSYSLASIARWYACCTKRLSKPPSTQWCWQTRATAEAVGEGGQGMALRGREEERGAEEGELAYVKCV